MKYFTFFVFLFLSIFVSAQMTLEEISYVPSPSGYYHNLVVKGDTNIKELITYPFNIISYGSLLKVNIDDKSKLSVGTVSVSTGTAYFDSDYSVDTVSNLNLISPTQENTPKINITMNGGNLSFRGNNGTLQVDPITFNDSISKTPLLTIRTEQLTSSSYPRAKDLYILGMKIPPCSGGYYWQPVKVNSALYYILACNTTVCTNPEYEEACVQKGSASFPNHWNTTKCRCENQNDNPVSLDSPIPQD